MALTKQLHLCYHIQTVLVGYASAVVAVVVGHEDKLTLRVDLSEPAHQCIVTCPILLREPRIVWLIGIVNPQAENHQIRRDVFSLLYEVLAAQKALSSGSIDTHSMIHQPTLRANHFNPLKNVGWIALHTIEVYGNTIDHLVKEPATNPGHSIYHYTIGRRIAKGLHRVGCHVLEDAKLVKLVRLLTVDKALKHKTRVLVVRDGINTRESPRTVVLRNAVSATLPFTNLIDVDVTWHVGVGQTVREKEPTLYVELRCKLAQIHPHGMTQCTALHV